jgi:hypothetical protein
MLRAKDFHIANFQSIIFTPDLSAFSVPEILATILGKYAHRYDGSVQSLPLPEDIPPEVPRVVLQSKDGTYRLDLSPARVSSYWIRADEKQAEPEDMVSSCVEVLEDYMESMGVQVSRLALVLTRVCRTENPAQLLAERFCRPELQTTLFDHSENFEIHNHKRLKLKDFSFNAWVRCKTAGLLLDSSLVSAVIVEQDLNTLIEEVEQFRFAREEIRSYFQVASTEAEDTLQVYFPNKG